MFTFMLAKLESGLYVDVDVEVKKTDEVLSSVLLRYLVVFLNT